MTARNNSPRLWSGVAKACILAVLLTGIIMPDTPRPKRHPKSPVTGYAEKLKQGETTTKKDQSTATTRDARDRTGRMQLPSRKRN